MNLRQIEVFRAIMLTGSITDAARLLHVSQPGISRLVRHVESRLGMPLFERKRGRIQPTPEARALYAEIEKVYRGVKWIQNYAGGLKSGANALLRVLTTPSAGLELVPRAVAQLANAFPTARIFSEVVTIAQMTELLLAGHADVGVSAMHIDHPALELRQFGEWRLLCIFPTGHPLEAKRRIAVRDALNHRLVSFSKETLQGRIIEGWFDEQQLERKVSVEVRSAHMACALVASGAGVAFVDDLTARAYGPATLLSRPVPAARCSVSTPSRAATVLPPCSQSDSASASRAATVSYGSPNRPGRHEVPARIERTSECFADPNSMSAAPDPTAAPAGNFIRNIVEHDLAEGKYAARTWAASRPGDARTPARRATRRGSARAFRPSRTATCTSATPSRSASTSGSRATTAACATCASTTPTRRRKSRSTSTRSSTRCTGWASTGDRISTTRPTTSTTCTEFGEAFIEHGLAYVDEPERRRDARAARHADRAGQEQPVPRPAAGGEPRSVPAHARRRVPGRRARAARSRSTWRSPNINLRDPVAYRIRHAHHHRTGDKWCIYPLYDYTHGVSDALENITHSICTLEFEDHRPLYDWLNERLADFGVLAPPLPQQYEFARLNLTYVVLSQAQADPAGRRTATSTAGTIRACRPSWAAAGAATRPRRSGSSPSASASPRPTRWIDMTILEDCLRDDLNERAPRRPRCSIRSSS